MPAPPARPLPARPESKVSNVHPDAELVARCVAGDRAAQRLLFTRLRPQVLRHLSFLTRRRLEIDDIAQDVFLEIFRSLRGFQGRSSLATWVHRITVRVTYRQLRRRWKGAPPPELHAEAEIAALANEGDPSREAEVRDRHTRALGILETLSPKKRLVLAMHDLQGLEAAEIARLLGAPVLTIRTRLFYARKEFASAARADPALAEYFSEDLEPEVSP
jgi:RNA polymerase sigma-70 factor (ECF subfamily)